MGQIDIISFMTHANFNHVQIGQLLPKSDLIQWVELQIQNQQWFSNESTYKYRNLAKHVVGQTVNTYGQITIRTPSEVLIFNLSDLWVYHPQDSWKLLCFAISPFATNV